MFVCMFVHVCMYVCMYACIPWMNVCMYMHVFIYVCMYICTYVCMNWMYERCWIPTWELNPQLHLTRPARLNWSSTWVQSPTWEFSISSPNLSYFVSIYGALSHDMWVYDIHIILLLSANVMNFTDIFLIKFFLQTFTKYKKT